MFAGTNQRWEVVASFINQHTKTPEIVRTAKETLFKAKELQHGDFSHSSLKEEANKKAFENLENSKKKDMKVKVIIINLNLLISNSIFFETSRNYISFVLRRIPITKLNFSD